MNGASEALRERMVREQVEARGVRDPLVLGALRAVPRHLFVPPPFESDAYSDRPLPIGLGQSISQPYIVGFMAELLETAGRRVLELGTGSGYQTAVLARLASEVFSVEVEGELSRGAGEVLASLGVSNVRLMVGDGLQGWPAKAPFARIMVTAGVPRLPQPLLDQLEPGGRLLAPVGHEGRQVLVQVDKEPAGLRTREVMPVVFVQAHGGRLS